MRLRWIALLALLVVGGCSPASGSRNFSVYFQPYSADLDEQAHETIGTAAAFANANPLLPVEVAGFAAPPDPKLDVEGLSAKRAGMVKQLLIGDGVRPDRIATVANGITDPKSLPSVGVRRVDIGR